MRSGSCPLSTVRLNRSYSSSLLSGICSLLLAISFFIIFFMYPAFALYLSSLASHSSTAVVACAISNDDMSCTPHLCSAGQAKLTGCSFVLKFAVHDKTICHISGSREYGLSICLGLPGTYVTGKCANQVRSQE